MSWFRKKKEEERLEIAKKASIEIAAAKQASGVASKQAIKDAEQLKELLERNHFSVTLYIAVGGKAPRRQKGKIRHA